MTPQETSVALRGRELIPKHSLKGTTWLLLRNKAGSLERRHGRRGKPWKQCGEWGGGCTAGELKLRSETVHEARFVGIRDISVVVEVSGLLRETLLFKLMFLFFSFDTMHGSRNGLNTPLCDFVWVCG